MKNNDEPTRLKSNDISNFTPFRFPFPETFISLEIEVKQVHPPSLKNIKDKTF